MVNHTGLIEAQTLATGEEGRIFLLADMQSGTVVADGRLDVSAPLGGDGGFAETSAARVLVRDGFRVDALSAFGKTGTWLLDPDVLNITATGTDILSGLPLTGDSFVSVATLNTALSSADVELQANSHIDIRTAFTYAGSRDAKLSLYAPLVLLGADIGSASAANLSLRFGGLFAGNGINYAGDLYLYDAAAGATTCRTSSVHCRPSGSTWRSGCARGASGATSWRPRPARRAAAMRPRVDGWRPWSAGAWRRPRRSRRRPRAAERHSPVLVRPVSRSKAAIDGTSRASVAKP
jgi:hypothetical protein